MNTNIVLDKVAEQLPPELKRLISKIYLELIAKEALKIREDLEDSFFFAYSQRTMRYKVYPELYTRHQYESEEGRRDVYRVVMRLFYIRFRNLTSFFLRNHPESFYCNDMPLNSKLILFFDYARVEPVNSPK